MSAIMRDPFDPLVCDAGRRAGFGGRWRTPCQHRFAKGDQLHTVGWPGAADMGGPMHFCPEHFAQLAAAGLVPNEPIPEAEFERRMGEVE